MGNRVCYRSIYSVKGKTYHLSAEIHKETQVVEEKYWNEVVEIPTNREELVL